MLLLNFAHPLTDEQLAQASNLLDAVLTVQTIPTHVDRQRPLAEVAHEMVNAVEISPDDWQTLPIIINPPGLASLALALIANIHGRAGYFVPMLNIRPEADTTPQRFEVAEIINL